MGIIKVGNVELTEQDASEIYTQGKYIVTYSKIYQMFYSQNAGYYGNVIHTKVTKGGIGFAKRGRYNVLSAKEVNNMLGYELLNIA